MPEKLTLSMDREVIQKTKEWAQKHRTSLSKLVENYFTFIITDTNDDSHLAPITKSLIGVFKSKDSELSYKDLIRKYKGGE